MFSYCSGLTSITFGNDFSFESIAYTNSLMGFIGNCNNLDNTTLNGILGLLLTVPVSWAGTKTLKEVGFSSSQATTAQTLSNWSACVSAGWSTGY